MSAEIIIVLSLLFSLISIVFITKFYGKTGLYVYVAVAVVTSNIQVLTAAHLWPAKEPIAMGIIFTTIFLASDILNELYGKKAALKTIWIGFLSYFLITIWMLFIIYTPALNVDVSSPYQHFNNAKSAVHILFTPAPSIFIASIVAYVASQYSDVFIFSLMKNITHKKLLWLRICVSVIISTTLDHIIFCTLAFVILAPQPISWHELLYSYILVTLLLRLLISLTFIPTLYITKYICKDDSKFK